MPSVFAAVLPVAKYLFSIICLNVLCFLLPLLLLTLLLHTAASAAQHHSDKCTCRVAWPAIMKGWEQWRDVYSAEGQLLFAGLRAKVSVFHGQMTRIVPHTTTGHLLSVLHSLHAWHQ